MAIDRYVYVREAYLQHREYLIHDGNPPIDDLFDDEFLMEDSFEDGNGQNGTQGPTGGDDL